MKKLLMIFIILISSFQLFANDTLQTAQYLGKLSSRGFQITDTVSGHDENDYFSFDIVRTSKIQIVLSGMRDNANLALYNAQGHMLGLSTNEGVSNDTLTKNLPAGRYYARVASYRRIANTQYTLNIKDLNPRSGSGANISDIVIRGIVYKDHSPYTRAVSSSVLLGDYFEIHSSTMNFNAPGVLKVILQDASRPPNSFGVTVFELKGLHRYGNRLQVQAPFLQVFRNRSFHVTVFHYTASSRQYAYAGLIQFR